MSWNPWAGRACLYLPFVNNFVSRVGESAQKPGVSFRSAVLAYDVRLLIHDTAESALPHLAATHHLGRCLCTMKSDTSHLKTRHSGKHNNFAHSADTEQHTKPPDAGLDQH
eukprot:g50419.t1